MKAECTDSTYRRVRRVRKDNPDLGLYEDRAVALIRLPDVHWGDAADKWLGRSLLLRSSSLGGRLSLLADLRLKVRADNVDRARILLVSAIYGTPRPAAVSSRQRTRRHALHLLVEQLDAERLAAQMLATRIKERL